MAYSLFLDGKPKAAENAVKELTRIKGRRARAKIMLARCKAALNNYDQCEKIISSLFGANSCPAAQERRTAFVHHSIGMTADAIKEIVKLVNQYPDLPTAGLYLGNLFNEAGDLKMAVRCWKLAAKRDRRGGAIGKNQIGRFSEHVKKKKLPLTKKRTSKRARNPTASRA